MACSPIHQADRAPTESRTVYSAIRPTPVDRGPFDWDRTSDGALDEVPGRPRTMFRCPACCQDKPRPVQRRFKFKGVCLDCQPSLVAVRKGGPPSPLGDAIASFVAKRSAGDTFTRADVLLACCGRSAVKHRSSESQCFQRKMYNLERKGLVRREGGCRGTSFTRI